MNVFRKSPMTFTGLSQAGRSLLQIGLAASLLLSAVPMTAFAIDFVPPNRGMPGRREGGGTRGCWGNANSIPTDTRLTALVPAENFGYTLESSPSFFVYIPSFFAEKTVAAQFEIINEAGDRLYEATYQTSQESGLIRINLPEDANFSGLEVGQDYNWAFTLVCDINDPSGNLVVDSWIQRIEPDVELAEALQTAPAEQVPDLYAQAGVWHDTLTSLADLPNGDQPQEMERWRTLLNEVGLTAVAQELVPESVSVFPVPEDAAAPEDTAAPEDAEL
ncbi:DUF928 domain-containing protein [Vacuolonema iberomarrocanum]|uniref:DUF928 domain-containing protein n=1 Tax=Vacuolonema iberomarrocanum TaxID=3454632 RepID=UPI003F6E213F